MIHTYPTDGKCRPLGVTVESFLSTKPRNVPWPSDTCLELRANERYGI